MVFQIVILEKEKACQITNEKGDYIVLDFPNDKSYFKLKSFIRDSDA